jgi:very-short-patch-repair endonuclease
VLKDISPEPDAGVITRARKLRRKMSLPEVLLWKELRSRPGGLKFRRQHPAGPYVVDFFCADARLAIEVDGEAHSMGTHPQRDRQRDAWFQRNDIETLRISAKDVLADLPAALDWIMVSCRNRLPLHHPAGAGWSPSPSKLGEDLAEVQIRRTSLHITSSIERAPAASMARRSKPRATPEAGGMQASAARKSSSMG